uniref:Uncharacterized protein n=1 Tax=Kalanchoe fedtschenkoi TaxID=63787 RepID=A0A7N1A891_KALFE
MWVDPFLTFCGTWATTRLAYSQGRAWMWDIFHQALPSLLQNTLGRPQHFLPTAAPAARANTGARSPDRQPLFSAFQPIPRRWAAPLSLLRRRPPEAPPPCCAPTRRSTACLPVDPPSSAVGSKYYSPTASFFKKLAVGSIPMEHQAAAPTTAGLPLAPEPKDPPALLQSASPPPSIPPANAGQDPPAAPAPAQAGTCSDSSSCP